MKNRQILFGLLLITFQLFSCIDRTRKIENLETFANVYGYVRWFYPGDEAAKIDWTKVAVYGINKVENARSQKQLKNELLDLFKPIAPALQIEDALQEPKFNLKSIVPPDTSGFLPITWVHYGVYLGKKSNIYQSKRINRQTPNTQLNNYYGEEVDLTSYRAKIGDYITKNIGSNLICVMPLVVYGTSKQTYPIADTSYTQKLNNELQHVPDYYFNTKSHDVRLANIIIAWNVLQHFYPYFDVVKVNWKKVLSKTLNEVFDAKTEVDYFKSLSRMIAKLEDGHGVVSCTNIEHWGLSASFACIENKVVISGSNSSLFISGDIIEIIDGKSAAVELSLQESLISGSPQLKRYRALNMFGSDFSQTTAEITLLRDGKQVKLHADRGIRCNLFFNSLTKGNIECIDYGNGIYYEKSRPSDFEKELNNLLKAKGIIIPSSFDVSKIVPHLIKEVVMSPIWNIPITTYPDRERVVFDTDQWTIEPKKPFISANIVFIDEPFIVSSGETNLSFTDYYQLGKLVGDTSAGTNGNVNFIPLMGGYSIMWTGMKVLKQDGSQHHLIGYKPEYPVKRTIQAIKENRNEYLDKALEILKN